MHLAWNKTMNGSSPNVPCTGQCNAQVKSRQVPEHGDENAFLLCPGQVFAKYSGGSIDVA